MDHTDKVIEIIRREMAMEIGEDQVITPDSELAADLHIDSLNMVLIIAGLEEEFDITIELDEAADIITVKDVSDKINELQAR